MSFVKQKTLKNFLKNTLLLLITQKTFLHYVLKSDKLRFLLYEIQFHRFIHHLSWSN